MMKVSINKLMRHSSHESDEVGADDIYEDLKILSCIKETMAVIEDGSFEELEDNPFSFSETAPNLKLLPFTLKYAFLDHHCANQVIISSQLDQDQEERLLMVLRGKKDAIGWNLLDLKGINPSLCTHRIFLQEDSCPSREAQRRLNPKVWDAIKDEVLKWLNACIIYLINDSPWVNPVHVVPKKAGITVRTNDKGVEHQTRLPTKWRVCIDYQKLNAATKKDHFLLEVDKAKVKVIQDLALPKSIRELRSFLGHVGFYHHFIQDFTKVSLPLTSLLRKEKDFIIE